MRNRQTGDEPGPADGRRRDKRPTMADVAQRVGVSRALVSLVFRNEPGASRETRERIFHAAEELGYRPDSAAQMLARSHSKVIGVAATVRNPFHADLVEAIYLVAERLGYDVLLSVVAPGRDDIKAVEGLLGHRCEALLLLGPNTTLEYINDLGRRLPLVVVGRRFPGVDCVLTADAKGVRQVIDHLVSLGHRSIVHVDGGRQPGSAERRRAYKTAMRRWGLADEIRILPGDHTEDSGVAAAETLLAEPHLPTAVLAGNDRCALGLLDAMRRAKVDIPGQVSVAGYDDSHIAHLSYIDLTTVRQDPDRMADLAVRTAVERLTDGELPAREHVLEPKLMVRGTTGPPRVGADNRWSTRTHDMLPAGDQ